MMHNMLQNDKYINDDVKLSSREVAKMLEFTRHNNFLQKIAKINKSLTNSTFSSLDYWVESTYIDAKGERRKEYLVSKKGCELLAHKTTGKKGVLFTLKYMERFEAMEEELKKLRVTPSHEIQDLIERALRWIEEQKERRTLALQELNETKYL